MRAENFRLMENPETYRRQMDAIRRRLLEKPHYQTFFVLDGKSGSLRCVPPIVYAESMNGSGMPPVITSDGRIIVKYQALLRSRYEHYSPFLNVGYLNPQSGDITPIMDQSRTYGWHDSLLLVHDEQCALVASGRVLINTHQNDVNGLDLDTLIGYSEPFCRNIHEPEPDEALGLWGLILSEKELPVGKEWLPRGTAVYGGGSSIDVAVTVADDGFYYLPSHELNAGCAVIAYRMDPAGTAHEKSSVPKLELTPTLRETLRGLPWDWDTLLSPRLRKLCGPLAEAAPDAALAVAADDHLSDEQLNRLILDDETSNRTIVELTNPDASQIRALLEKEVDRVLDIADSPWIFPAAKHPQEAYRFFADPAETLWALALAYPYLGPKRQARVREFVKEGQSPGGPWEPPLGRENWPKEDLAGRESYRVSPRPRLILDDRHFDRWTRLYIFWRWAVVTGDFATLQGSWPEIKIALRAETSNSDVDLGNGRLAGQIAYCRLAQHFHDEDALSEGLRAARAAIRERLRYERLHPQSGLMAEAKNGRYVFARWRNLTPEVADILRTFTLPTQKTLWSIYVDYHRPTWWLAWNVETAWRNESPFSLPSLSEELYAARALLLRSSPKQLLQTLDIPWCRGDLFFIRKAAHALTAMSQPNQFE